ncbi:MAG: hypothetical protein AMXMBFR23_03070 [Chloroflexota bacterium]
MTIDIEQVKRQHPIADVIAAHGVALRPTGRKYMGRCPFHQDDRPSLVVYPDTQSFHCFGCGASGDVIDFVRRTHNASFREAVDHLGDLPRPAPQPRETAAPRPQPPHLSLDDRLILTAACELYHEALLRTPSALAYLDARGVPRWLARRARLGFSDGSELAPYLKRRRLSLRRAGELGLLYGDEREAMRGRIVIPDLRSGYCAWMTGRALGSDARTKYLGLALPRPLLGYEGVRGRQRIFVTEGPFDWLTLVGWGLPACALLGTQPGRGVERLLDRARSVVLVLDADDPGRAAAASFAESMGGRVLVLDLPGDVKDVSELGARPGGREAFFRALDAAEAQARSVEQEGARHAAPSR